MTKRIALYAGSFDPYTNGHHDIAKKACALFDEVVVMIAVNVQKKRSSDAEAMRRAIQQTLDDDGLHNARAVIHTALVADYCAEHGIRWYVRGLRNSMDYNYEENIAQINHLINPALESIYLRSDDPAISSSMIRELRAFGKDVSKYVPEAVFELLETGN